MNKKSIYRIILLLLFGGAIGAAFSIGLFRFGEAGGLAKISDIGNFLISINVYLFLFLVIALFLPSVYLFMKAKKAYGEIDEMSEDDYEDKEITAKKKLDMALTLNSIFMVLNFLVFGTTLDKTSDNFIIILIVFLANAMAMALFEIYVIRFIQREDTRLKGDPTTFRFTKEFIESCDEAEKQRIYRSGYHAFQSSKAASLGFILITVISNMVLETGALPVLISCIWMLQNVASYGYYSVYKK